MIFRSPGDGQPPLVSRRAVLANGLAAGLGWAVARPAHAADEYLEDPRTARAVWFRSPRAPLRECLRVLASASGITLSAAPALAEEPLVGHVRDRPLRELMGALEELFDATWTALPSGAGPRAYRLDPHPERMRAAQAARRQLLARFQKGIDEAAADAARRVRSGEPIPMDLNQQTQTLSVLLWSYLSPADRERVLQGSVVTVSVPEAGVRPVNQLVLAISRKSEERLTAPMLATFDLDDRDDRGLPVIRARVTALREQSLVGAIGLIYYTRLQAAPRPAEPRDNPADTAAFPTGIGDGGRISGTRDEVAEELGRAGNVPVLSRHRAYGGNYSVAVAGRRIAQVMAEFAADCDASVRINARGFFLIRSLTEALDAVGIPPGEIVRRYLERRPAPGRRVPFALLAELGALSPMQLSILQRSNLCSNEAGFARETYALLRFYRLLSPPQREALFGREGLDVAALSHPQLHALLDERQKRGDFDIYQHLQEIPGLRLRFREQLDSPENSLTLEALRDGESLTSSTLNLPETEEELKPAAGA